MVAGLYSFLSDAEVLYRFNLLFLRKCQYPEGGKIGKISAVCLVASMDVRIHRDMIDKQDLLEHFYLIHTVLMCYCRHLSHKICL